MARPRQTFEPVTLGHIRSRGCRDLLVYCTSPWCNHDAKLTFDWLPDDLPVRALCRRMVCTRCGLVGADVRPAWSSHTGGTGIGGAIIRPLMSIVALTLAGCKDSRDPTEIELEKEFGREAVLVRTCHGDDPNLATGETEDAMSKMSFLLLGAMLICLGALITWRTPVNRWAWDSIRQIAGHFVVELLNQVALYAVLIGIVLLLYGLFGM